MSDDEEDACPLCILPFSEQDASFTPCPCGFKICVWCWHKIIDIAGSVSENSLDQVGQCPHCRTPFDVEAVLDQQRKLAASTKKGGKGGADGLDPAVRAKRKAVASKQAFADTVVVDGKTVALENVPGTAFLPAVLASLADYLTGMDTPDNTARKFLLNKLEAIKEEKRKKAQGQQSQKKLTKRQKKTLADAAENGDAAEDDEADELEEEVFTEDDSDDFSEDGDEMTPQQKVSYQQLPIAPKSNTTNGKNAAIGYNSAAVGVSSKGALDSLDVPEAANFNRVAALCLSRRELSQGEATSEASSKLAKDALPLPLLRSLRDVRAVLRALLTQDRHAEEVGRILTGEALLPTYTNVVAKPALDDDLRKMLEEDAILHNLHARSNSASTAGSNPNVSSRVSGSQETSVSNILQDITNMAIYHPHLLASTTTDVLYYNNPFFDRCWAKLFLREDTIDDSIVPELPKKAATTTATTTTTATATATTPAVTSGGGGLTTRRPLATKAAPMPLDGGFNDSTNGHPQHLESASSPSLTASSSVEQSSTKCQDDDGGISSLKDDEVAALATILAPYDLSYLEENIDALATQASRQWVKGTNNAVDLRGVMTDCDGSVGSNSTNVAGNSHNRILLNNAYFNAKARLLLERRRMNYRMWVRLCVQAVCSAQAQACAVAEDNSCTDESNIGGNIGNLGYETLQLMLRTLTSFSTATVGIDAEVTAAAAAATTTTTGASVTAATIIPALTAPPLAPKQTALWMDALLRSQEHTVASDRLVLFGKILCHYVSRKEASFLSNEERLELLKQQSMIGRFGQVTDGQFFAVPNSTRSTPLCPTSPSSANNNEDSSAEGGSGGAVASLATKVANSICETFYDTVNTEGLLPHTGTLVRLYHRYTYGLNIKLFFEGLNSNNTSPSGGGGAKHVAVPKSFNASALSNLPIAGYSPLLLPTTANAPFASASSTSSSSPAATPSWVISHVLPVQRYTVILRFSTVAEAVACVASGVDHALQEGMVAASTSAATVGGGGCQTLFRLSSSSSAASSSSSSSMPRVKVGLVPTRYCSQFLKNSMCEKLFCTEIHQECQFNQQTTISSSNPKSIVAAIQDHFFASAITVAASSIGSKPSFSRQGSTTDLSHLSNQSPLGFAGQAGSTVSGPPVVRGVPAGALVGASQPLLLKHIKAAEFSVLRNDFVTPAPDHINVDSEVTLSANPIPIVSPRPQQLRITTMSMHFEAEKAIALKKYVLTVLVKYQQQLLVVYKAPSPPTASDSSSSLPTTATTTTVLRGTGKVLMLDSSSKTSANNKASIPAAAGAACSGGEVGGDHAVVPVVLMPSQILCNPNTDGYAHEKGCQSPVAKGGYNYMDTTLPFEFGHSASLAHVSPAWALALAADTLSESEALLGKYEAFLKSNQQQQQQQDGHHHHQQRDFVYMTILTLGRQLGLTSPATTTTSNKTRVAVDHDGELQQQQLPQSKALLAHFWDTLASLAVSYKDGGSMPALIPTVTTTTTSSSHASNTPKRTAVSTSGGSRAPASHMSTPQKRPASTTSSSSTGSGYDIYSPHRPLVGEDLNTLWLSTLSSAASSSATMGVTASEREKEDDATTTPISLLPPSQQNNNDEVDLHGLIEDLTKSSASLSTLSLILRQFITDSFLREIPTLSTTYYTVAGDERIRAVAAARGMSAGNIEKLLARMVVLNQGTLILLGRLASVVQQLLDVTNKVRACYDQYELIRYLVPLERARALAGVVAFGDHQHHNGCGYDRSHDATLTESIGVSDMGGSVTAAAAAAKSGGSSITKLQHSLSGSVTTATTTPLLGGSLPNNKASGSTTSNPWGKPPPAPITGLNDSGSSFPHTPAGGGTPSSWGAAPSPIHDDPWASLGPKNGSGVWGDLPKHQQPRAPAESMADKLAKKFGGVVPAGSPSSGPPNPVGTGGLLGGGGMSGVSTPTSLGPRLQQQRGSGSGGGGGGASFSGIQPIDSCLGNDEGGSIHHHPINTDVNNHSTTTNGSAAAPYPSSPAGASCAGGMLGSRSESNIYGSSSNMMTDAHNGTTTNSGVASRLHGSGNGALHLHATVSTAEVVGELPTGVKVATQSLVAWGSKVVFATQALRQSLLNSHEDFIRAITTAPPSKDNDVVSTTTTVPAKKQQPLLRYTAVVKGWLATLAVTEEDATMHNIFVPALRILFRRFLSFDLLRHAAVASPTIMNLVALRSVESGLHALRAPSSQSVAITAMYAISVQYAVGDSTNRLDTDRGGPYYYSRSLHRTAATPSEGQYSCSMLTRLRSKAVKAIRVKCTDSAPCGLLSTQAPPQTEAIVAAKKLLGNNSNTNTKVVASSTVPFFQAPLLLTMFPDLESCPPSGPYPGVLPATKPFADERAPLSATRRPLVPPAATTTAHGRGRGGGGKYN